MGWKLPTCTPLPTILAHYYLSFIPKSCLLLHPHPNQDWSSLMYSLVDRVPEPKDTQMDWVQPHSAGPAELSVSESVVEVGCILMMLSGLHVRLGVWHSVPTSQHTYLFTPLLLISVPCTVMAASCKCCKSKSDVAH